MVFWLCAVYNKHEIIQIGNQTSGKSHVLSQVLISFAVNCMFFVYGSANGIAREAGRLCRIRFRNKVLRNQGTVQRLHRQIWEIGSFRSKRSHKSTTDHKNDRSSRRNPRGSGSPA